MKKYIQFIKEIDNYWQQYVYAYNIVYTNIPIGAATFNELTINIFSNKQNISFCCVCYRPYDFVAHKVTIRSHMYLQYQVLMYNVDDVRHEVQKFIEFLLPQYKGALMFVEDHWSAPTMCAYGYGWELRINNLEVSQLTYFTKFLGNSVVYDNIVEVVFGIERLYMLRYSKKHIDAVQVDDSNANILYNVYVNKSKNELVDELNMLLYNKRDYNSFLLANFIFNLLDAQRVYTESVKSITMRAIYNML